MIAGRVTFHNFRRVTHSRASPRTTGLLGSAMTNVGGGIRDEALMDWRRDTERLIKAMRDALPPGHPLAADADRWLDGCDYWIEDIMADRDLPPLEPGGGRFGRPSG